MIRLQTLGSLDLRAPDGTILQPVLRQPKRLALLAYLAIEKPGQFHRRDELLGLFWPESDLKGGRASLSQAVHFLRHHLGKDAIVNRGDEEIGIAADLVWCDARAFQQLLHEKRYGEALDLYKGRLLPAFFVDESNGFEQWVEQKRDTLQREAMRACIAQADIAAGAASYDEEVEWLRRAIRYFPFDESLHRRLIRAYDLSGDRAAALLAYDELVETLKREFESEPSAETLEVVQAVRTRSEARPLNEPLRNTRTFSATSPVGQTVTRRLRRRYAVLVSMAALAITAALWGAFTREKPAREAPMTRIAVLFFKDLSPAGELGYLAEGLTTTLINHLGGVRQIQVISANGVRPFRGDSISTDSISHILDVGTIVEGSVSESQGRVRVTVDMVNALNGVVLRTKNFERPLGELFALLDDMSRELALFLRGTLGEEIQYRDWQAQTRSVAAWQLLQRAEYLRNAADLHAQAGDMSAAANELTFADSLLQRAGALDAKWVEPLVIRGRIAERRAWLSFATDRPPQPLKWLVDAENLANAALEVDRRSARALEVRGSVNLLRMVLGAPSALTSDTLLRAAERDLTSALGIDPNMPKSESALSAVYFAQGRFQEARGAAIRALEADAYLKDADDIVNRLFAASFEVGDDAEAGYWCDEIRSRMPNRWPAAYCDLVLLGWGRNAGAPQKALLLLERFGSDEPSTVREAMRPRLTILTAAVLARAGQRDSARAMLKAARTTAPHDIELLPLEASVRVQLGEEERAAELLDSYWEVNPSAKSRLVNSRMFRELRQPQALPMSRNANRQ